MGVLRHLAGWASARGLRGLPGPPSPQERPEPSANARRISDEATTTLVVLAIVGMLGACSRSGDLSGDVFVTMKSGDIKRGADVSVALAG